MKWTEKHIKELQQKGHIRSATMVKKKNRMPANTSSFIPPAKGKALVWLEWNLMYWSNEHSLTMEREYLFMQDRKFRFDFCWPAVKLALEFEGGIYLKHSGHNTAKHYTKDTDKYNHAALLGWTVIRVTAMNYKKAPELLTQSIKNK